MLAGLQTVTDSLFPAIRGLTPSQEELDKGEAKVRFGKTIRISGYKTEVFDMHDSKSRAAYNKRMLELSQRAQLGTVRLLVHDRGIMSRKDGSTGWFGYLEWMEYKRGEDNNDAGQEKPAKEAKDGKEV